MPLSACLAVTWALLAGAAPSRADLAGPWAQHGVTLNLEASGKGTLAGLDEGDADLTWDVERHTVTLRRGDQRIDCGLTLTRDLLACRCADRSCHPFQLKGPRPPYREPPPPPRPCEVHAVGGSSAGPVRLGMTSAQLVKLGFTKGQTVEWLVKPGYRVQINPTSGVVVAVRVEGAVCLDSAPPGSRCFPELRTGGTFTDCPTGGFRSVESDRGGGGWIEVFAPVKAAAPAECALRVVPGASVGPVRLGMSTAEFSRLGLGFWFDATFPSQAFGPFRLLLDTGGKIAAIDLGVDGARACLDSQALDATWRSGELCARGFCQCTLAQDSLAVGVMRASCPEGIRFSFERQPPGKLFGVLVEPASRALDAGSAKKP